MALTSSGTLAFSTIKGEFGGGSSNISLSEYYRDPEGVVSGNNTDVPSGGNSGPISVSDFYSSEFQLYVTYKVIGGGGGGGGGASSGSVSGNPRGASGSSSTLAEQGTSTGFSTITGSGGTGGLSGHSSYSGSGGNTAGGASPLTGGGGGAKGSWSAGAGGDGSAAGAGGGGASGNNASWPSSDGYGGGGGSAGTQQAGSVYVKPTAVLRLTAGAGGTGYDSHADGGDGYQGYVSVTVRAPGTDGTWTDTKQSATQTSAGNSDVTIADTAYTG